MEELEKIREVIERVMGIGRGCASAPGRGRLMLAHIVREGYPHLLRMLSRHLSCEIADIHRWAFQLEEEASVDGLLLHVMREVETALELPPFKLRGRARVPRRRRCLGFEFTSEEEIWMRDAMRASAEYMRGVCGMGVQPLVEGCVVTRGR